MNERNHERTKSTVVGMDRKASANPPRAPRLPVTPAVTRTQTVDVRASKARALAFKETLPNHQNASATIRSASDEAARRRATAIASSEAATAQQRRAEGMVARVTRPARAEPTKRRTEGKAGIRAEEREGPSADAHDPGPRAPAPTSPGRALLESIAARDASEVTQLRAALLAETERADNAEAYASSVAGQQYEYTESLEASIVDLKLALVCETERCIIIIKKIDVFAHPKWGGETHVFSGEARQRSSSLKENSDVCEGDRGGSCRYQSPSLFLFLLVFGRHGHWAAPERLHPGGRARPPLITYERTKSRTNEIYGGRYGPEGPGESAEGTTAATHASCD